MNPVATLFYPVNRRTRGVVAALIAGALLAPQPTLAADALAVLGFVDAKGKTQTVEVERKSGLVSSKATRIPVDRWTLIPGDTLKTAGTPAPRELVLYTASDGDPHPLCTIEVRYFAVGGDRFRPLYRIQDRISVAREGDSWKPVPLGTGDPLLVELPGSGLPNPDGYSDKLVFGIPQATVAIGGWLVR
jgi:hypothetical protein